MNKKLWLITTLTAVYIALCAAGIAGFDAGSAGVMFRLLTIAALIFAVSRAFTGAAGRGGDGAALAGALGLGLLAAGEVYTFCHIYLLGGMAEDITVGNYSRNCAYIFFLSAVLYLLSKTLKWAKRAAGGLSAAAILCIFYGVVADNAAVLYYAALVMMVLCGLACVYALIIGNRETKAFALSLLALCLLDSANRLLILFNPGWLWRDIVVAPYPLAYIFISAGLLKLREVTDNE